MTLDISEPLYGGCFYLENFTPRRNEALLCVRSQRESFRYEAAV